MTNAVIYTRVSTREQGDSGLGLEAQEATCRRVCEQLGLIVVQVYAEVGTGKKAPMVRPEFAKAHARAIETKATLVIAKVDRLCRDFAHTVAYIEATVLPKLLVADSPNMSTLEQRIRAVIAAEERDYISQRTTEALAAKRQRGYVFGANSGQSSKAKALEVNRSSLERAMALRNDSKSLATIVNILAAEGYTNSKGNKWTVGLLSRHLSQHKDALVNEKKH